MKRLLFAFFVAFVAVADVFAWGQKGHDVVAEIARRHFTTAAADSVDAIFDGMSPVYWANWLDNASHTPEYAYTKTWHYKNVNDSVAYEDVAPVASGDIVTALRAQIAVLADNAADKAQKALALKIVVHLMGDLHQPMHLGHKTDLGGNKTQVRFFDRGTNLHAVWDSSIPGAAHDWTFTEWADQLDRLSSSTTEQLQSGNIDDWAKECVEIASRIYQSTPVGTKISYDQIAYWTPVVEQQLLRAGLRLAAVLNAVFDPASQRSPSLF